MSGCSTEVVEFIVYIANCWPIFSITSDVYLVCLGPLVSSISQSLQFNNALNSFYILKYKVMVFLYVREGTLNVQSNCYLWALEENPLMKHALEIQWTYWCGTYLQFCSRFLCFGMHLEIDKFVCVCVCGFAGEAGEATEHYQLSLAKNFTFDEVK